MNFYILGKIAVGPNELLKIKTSRELFSLSKNGANLCFLQKNFPTRNQVHKDASVALCSTKKEKI